MFENAIRRALSCYLLEPLFWRFKGLPVFECNRQFRALQYQSNLECKSRQEEKLGQLISYAIRNVPFYAEYAHALEKLVEEGGVWTALEMLPIVSKADLQAGGEKFCSSETGQRIVNFSGGSTGKPIKVYQDKTVKTNAAAATMLFYEWAGKHSGDSNAKLWGAERDLIKNGAGIGQGIADIIRNRQTLNAFRMSAERMREYVKVLNKRRPLLLEGYADSLYELANFAHDCQLQIAPPRSIVSSAGTLHPHMKNKIEAVFSAPVFNRYGSREAGNIAAECEYRHGMHIFEELNVVEIVNDAGGPCSPGEVGRILITKLDNYTMPLIRYEIGDRGVLSARTCECGRPYALLEELAGRTNSVIRTTSGKVISSVFFAHMFGVMFNDGTIEEYQVRQETLGKIQLRIKLFDGKRLEDWTKRDDLLNLLARELDGADIDISIEDSIERTMTGKKLDVVSSL